MMNAAEFLTRLYKGEIGGDLLIQTRRGWRLMDDPRSVQLIADETLLPSDELAALVELAVVPQSCAWHEIKLDGKTVRVADALAAYYVLEAYSLVEPYAEYESTGFGYTIMGTYDFEGTVYRGPYLSYEDAVASVYNLVATDIELRAGDDKTPSKVRSETSVEICSARARTKRVCWVVLKRGEEFAPMVFGEDVRTEGFFDLIEIEEQVMLRGHDYDFMESYREALEELCDFAPGYAEIVKRADRKVTDLLKRLLQGSSSSPEDEQDDSEADWLDEDGMAPVV
jgi:hypothetical protein